MQKVTDFDIGANIYYGISDLKYLFSCKAVIKCIEISTEGYSQIDKAVLCCFLDI